MCKRNTVHFTVQTYSSRNLLNNLSFMANYPSGADKVCSFKIYCYL